MTTTIKNIHVSESAGEMHLAFTCHDEKENNISARIYNELVPSKSSGSEWYDFHYNFDIKLTEENNRSRLEFREKNNPAGMYGKASQLLMLPSILLSKGIVDVEQMNNFYDALYQSDPIKAQRDSLKQASPGAKLF